MAHVNRYASYECDGWMICNLRKYGNTLIDKKIVRFLKGNKDRIQAIIEYAYGAPIDLHEGKSGLYAEIIR